MSLTKDKRFYFEDGNCIFRVDDHLFNIHRGLLTRESPFFEDMFALLREPTTKDDGTEMAEKFYEGCSDDNPIISQDSLTSFRALCWGLYLRPMEVCAQEDSAKVDLSRLVSLGLIAHKYQFTLLEKWAITILRKHWTSDFPTATTSTPERLRESQWSLDMIAQLMVLSTKPGCIDQGFKKAIRVESEWLSSFIANPEDFSEAEKALNHADSFLSHKDRGLVYYRVLRRVGLFHLPHALDSVGSGSYRNLGPDTFRDCNKAVGMTAELPHDQRLKLMRGLWRLVSLRGTSSLGRVRFQCTCPSPKSVGEPQADTVFHHTVSLSDCYLGWDMIWMSLCDTLDLGAMIEEALHRLEGASGECIKADCRKRLTDELKTLLTSFEENLVNYFVSP